MPEPFVLRPRTTSGLAVEDVPVPKAVDAAFGALAEHVRDPLVTDIFVNGSAGLFVDRGEGAERVADWRASEREVRHLAVALVGAGGRHLDDQSPCVDVRLDDGIRVHAVLPPLAPEGTAISIRVPRLDRPGLDDLERSGMFESGVRARLAELVVRRENILVTGAAGAGKTTLLAALLGEAPHSERIVTIEDVAELRLDHPHHVRLEARQPNLEGVGAVGLSRLVREALRMRPDRLVVGECRGEELRELLSALNTGHDGGAGTLEHAAPRRPDAQHLGGRLITAGGRALGGQRVEQLARGLLGTHALPAGGPVLTVGPPGAARLVVHVHVFNLPLGVRARRRATRACRSRAGASGVTTNERGRPDGRRAGPSKRARLHARCRRNRRQRPSLTTFSAAGPFWPCTMWLWRGILPGEARSAFPKGATIELKGDVADVNSIMVQAIGGLIGEAIKNKATEKIEEDLGDRLKDILKKK